MSGAAVGYEVQLARVELELLESRVPEVARPSDVDDQGTLEFFPDGEVSGIHHGSIVSGGFDLVVFAVLRDLRERDLNVLVSGHGLFPLYEVIDFITLDEDGHPVRGVAAAIGDMKNGGFGIPFDGPINMGWIELLGSVAAADRVRFFTECVRVLGNLVRFGGLGESVRGDLVGILRVLVSHLRSAVRDACRDNPADTDEEGRAGSDVGTDDLRVHEPESTYGAAND